MMCIKLLQVQFDAEGNLPHHAPHSPLECVGILSSGLRHFAYDYSSRICQKRWTFGRNGDINKFSCPADRFVVC